MGGEAAVPGSRAPVLLGGWEPDSRLRKAELHRHPVDAPSRPPANPSVTSGSSQAAQAGRPLNSVSSQGGGAVPSSDHLQGSVRPSEGPAAWAPVTLEGAQ
ncbi:unnamed protein product [Rangifer tarandus platyrhynchus]